MANEKGENSHKGKHKGKGWGHREKGRQRGKRQKEEGVIERREEEMGRGRYRGERRWKMGRWREEEQTCEVGAKGR